MSEKSTIQWTDSTHNFWQGCTKVSAGCAHCYAEARDKRFSGGIHWGKGAPRVRSSSFEEPLKWNKKPMVCDKCGNAQENDTFCYVDGCDGALFHRRRVFSLSLGDWLDPEVPIAWLADMLDVIRRCPNLDWLLVTKRPELWRERLVEVWKIGESPKEVTHWVDDWLKGHAPANVMVLTSVENQEVAETRIPELLKIPARWHGMSCEPLLGPVDFKGWIRRPGTYPINFPGIDWVIAGGESGHNARPCNVEWIQSLKNQCAGLVPFFVKQLGAVSLDGTGYDTGITDKKGGDMSEWPEDLRTREFYQ